MVPSILHISSHGDYGELLEKELESTSEDEDNIGDLYNLLNQIKTKLVVINACHNSKILEVFKESKIPIVITYNKKRENENQIKDFCKIFYNSLLSGETIGSAFEQAKKGNSQHDNFESIFQCDNHEHEEKCLFKNLSKEIKE